MNSNYEKSDRGRTRKCVERRSKRWHLNNIIRESRIEEISREIFRIDVTDFESLLTQIFNLISLQERLGGTIECNKILALTLRYLKTGESFQSLSFQYRIFFNSVSYIIKCSCKAFVERMASVFVKVLSRKAEWVNISRKFKEVAHALGTIDGKYICFSNQRMVARFITTTNTLIP